MRDDPSLCARTSHSDGPSAQGLCLGRLPDGRKRGRPGSVLGAAGNARHHPARRLPCSEESRQDDPARPLRHHASTPISKASSTAAPKRGEDRRNTWINAPIREAYVELHRRGHCHSVEAWREGELVGGLYGVSLGRAFFGESMFSRERDASKICLVHLVERLNERRLRAARHAVHHRPPEALRRGRRAAPQIREAAGEGAGGRSAVLSVERRPYFAAAACSPSGVCWWNIIFQPSSRFA